VETTIDGTQAVIDLVGPGKGSPPDLQRTATRAMLQAMRRHQVKRLIVLASLPFGILDPQDRPSLMDKAMMFLAKSLMASMVQDARGHIQLITQSEIDWTVVRAPRLSDAPLRGKYRIGYLDANTGKSIPRPDVAAFLLEVLMGNTYLQQMPLLSNRDT
jgi:putative NADH-flavin reductase